MFDDSDLPYDKIGTTHRRSMSHSVHSDAMVWVLDESYINMNLAGSLNQHTVIERFIHKHARSVCSYISSSLPPCSRNLKSFINLIK